MDPIVDEIDTTNAELDAANPPGLSLLAYRIGTHATFWRRMLGRLRSQNISLGPNLVAQPLAALTTRDADDPAIALLDTWAVVADVITFYQERIANEGYLRTASERRSVLELARLVGYELMPGVAASAFLSFTVEDAPGTAAAVVVPQGTRVQSIPAQGQLPQTFETSANLTARAEWNTLRPQLMQPQRLSASTRVLSLKGSGLNLRPGDMLLLVDGRSNPAVHIRGVMIDTQASVTHVDVGDEQLSELANESPHVFAFRASAGFYGSNAPAYASLSTTTTTTSTPPPGTPFNLRRYTNSQLINALWQVGGKSLVDRVYGAGSLSSPGLNALYGGEELDTFDLTPDQRAKVTAVLQAAINTVTINPGLYPSDWDADGGHSIWIDSRRSYWSSSDSKWFANSDVYLDRSISEVVPGSWVVFESSASQNVSQTTKVYQVAAVGEASVADYATNGKVTGLRLRRADGTHRLIESTETDKPAALHIRKTTAYIQSQELELAEQPLVGPLQGTRIQLDAMVPDLAPGQALIVSGKHIRARVAAIQPSPFLIDDDERSYQLEPGDILEVLQPAALWDVTTGTARELPAEELLRLSQQADSGVLIAWKLRTSAGVVGTVKAAAVQIELQPSADSDPVVSEVVMVGGTVASVSGTTLILREPLRGSYDRPTTTISANVVRATHGETVVEEVLGSGDGAQPNQRFKLSRPPLTYVPAPIASGAASTLIVRVNGVRWRQVAALYNLSPRDQIYTIQRDDAGNTYVIFGDGVNGSRLPTGQENVVATYRSGIGLEGNVGSGSLSLLQTRPLGIRSVANPLPAAGGAATEALDSARDHVPRAVLTLERIVSLQDYEDFARSFAGIGKAQATLLWTGETRLIHLTIAGTAGEPVDRGSDLYAALVTAIRGASNPLQRIRVDPYVSRLFNLEASIWVDPRYDRAAVETAVRESLVAAFAFEHRAFGQDATASEVLAMIQRVDGVVAVDLDQLFHSADPPELNTRLVATPAQVSQNMGGDVQIQPAVLLLINTRDPNGISFTSRPAHTNGTR